MSLTVYWSMLLFLADYSRQALKSSLKKNRLGGQNEVDSQVDIARGYKSSLSVKILLMKIQGWFDIYS